MDHGLRIISVLEIHFILISMKQYLRAMIYLAVFVILLIMLVCGFLFKVLVVNCFGFGLFIGNYYCLFSGV